ncbi:uncharacterized protein LOC125032870 [Penaeus chinensis]|uniref:uncharacterized protein LOC125032870 n=1 Tax=Penaeus chinensis TaxID=139456 RepID=UPI001FB58950|nr:uncharacterized protein LOC125032870 [Penaeus chinensis]
MEETAEHNIFYVLHLCYTPAIIVFGVLGNLTSISVFLGTRMKKLSSSYFLAAMAASDSTYLVLLFLQWLLDNDMFVSLIVEALHSHGGCKIMNYVGSTSASISVWLTVAYTLERCIAVQYPLLRATICTVGRAKLAIAFITVVNSLYYVYIFITTIQLPGFKDCGIYLDYRTVMMVLNALDITLMVFLPFCLIAVMNSLIVWKIWNFSRIFQVSENRTNARTCEGPGETPLTPLLPQPDSPPPAGTTPQPLHPAPTHSLPQPLPTNAAHTLPQSPPSTAPCYQHATPTTNVLALTQGPQPAADAPLPQSVKTTTVTSLCNEEPAQHEASQNVSVNESQKPSDKSHAEPRNPRCGFNSAPGTVLHTVHTDIISKDISMSDTNLMITTEVHMCVNIHKSGDAQQGLSGGPCGAHSNADGDEQEKPSLPNLEVSRCPVMNTKTSRDDVLKTEVTLSHTTAKDEIVQSYTSSKEIQTHINTENEVVKACASSENKVTRTHVTSDCRAATERPPEPTRNTEKNQDKSRGQDGSTVNRQDNSACRQESASHRQDNPSSTRNNITKMLLLISTLFILLQLPSCLVRAYVMITGHESELLVRLQRIFLCLYNSHFSINFILYSKCGSKFWECLRSMVLSKLKRLVRWYRVVFFNDQSV